MRPFILVFVLFCTLHLNQSFASDFIFFEENDSAFAQISILNLNFSAFTNSITLDDINEHFTDDSDGYLDDRDKEYLLEKFSGNSSITTYLETTPIDLNIRYLDYLFSISVTDLAYFDFQIPYDAPELLLMGNKKNQDYSFDDLQFNSSYYRKYRFGTEMNINKTFLENIFPDSSSLGLDISYVQGFAYVDANIRSSHLYTDELGKISGFVGVNALTAFSSDFGVNHEYANTEYISEIGIFNKPAGSGYSIDLYWQSNAKDSNWNLKFGLYDIGSIAWNSNTGEYISNSHFHFSDIFNESQLDSLEEAFDFESSEKNFSTMMPSNFKIEISTLLNHFIELPFNSLAYFSYRQALNSSHFNSYTPNLSLMLNNQFAAYLPSFGFGVRNNIFDQLEIPLFLSYQDSIFRCILGIRDVSSYLSSNKDNLSLYTNFTFFIF